VKTNDKEESSDEENGGDRGKQRQKGEQ